MSLSNILTQFNGDGSIAQAPGWSNLNVNSLEAEVLTGTNFSVTSTVYTTYGGFFILSADQINVPNGRFGDWFEIDPSNGGWSSDDFDDGQFIAPVSGVYQIYAQLSVSNPSQYSITFQANVNALNLFYSSVVKQGYIQYANPATPTFDSPIDLDGRIGSVYANGTVYLDAGQTLSIFGDSQSGTCSIYKQNLASGGNNVSFLSIIYLGK
jgi:hypothetical protein